MTSRTFLASIFLLLPVAALSQCNTLSVSVSASDTSTVQLYQAGLFLIPSGDQNLCQWEITTLEGAPVHDATTSGNFEEQSFMLFDHEVPITDSMQVVLEITNELEGIICTVTDTLFWEETEILPDSFIGNWAILGDYVGVEEGISSVSGPQGEFPLISVYPIPTRDHFIVDGVFRSISGVIYDAQGAIVLELGQLRVGETVNVKGLATGMYTVLFFDGKGQAFQPQRLLKH